MHASPQDAHDLSQEVLIRFLEFRSSPIVDSQRYLFGIARNVLADYLRKRKETREVCFDEAIDPMVSIEPAGRSGADQAELLCQLDTLALQMARLPDSQHEGEGYSYHETAQRLGLTVQTVAKYLTLAKAQLRAMAH